jgi:hypothetical protein
VAPPGRYSRKRAAVDFGGAQLADVSTRDSAGGNIIHEGADPAIIARALAETQSFLKQYVFEMDQRRETVLKEVQREIRGVRSDADVIRDSVQKMHVRLNTLVTDNERDLVTRHARQRILNWWLGVILGFVILLALAVAWLAWRELHPPIDVAALLRLWLGGALALVAKLWRR